MSMRNRGRALSNLRRVGLEIFEREGRVRDSIDSMDLEELSIITAHVFALMRLVRFVLYERCVVCLSLYLCSGDLDYTANGLGFS
ncbi:hypothetical protein M407DRAFT_245704 [Tulasnella calospora MUT 4182]|uniref:Uncharacterized protein n=1 Tax=Tulasnella calospora MUT 4182 TaxID=1051891 RepID=A0A0C3KGV6_9AGAM|nr:hypothetical protein M407DRAFT_245704 [Tulasnella calospora MUT 4182]